MELTEVQAVALAAMAEHGLYEWTLKFDRARKRAGVCKRSEQVISLSAPLMNLWTPEQCRDVILHEIAHALAPPRSGHGWDWQRICVQIGASPSRTWGEMGEAELPDLYIGTCDAGHEIGRDRIPRKPASCSQCSRRYDPRYGFTWRHA